MTEPNKCENKNKMRKNPLRALRISLKYRPDILRLILKMRLCIRRKNVILKKLKSELNDMKSSVKPTNHETTSNTEDIGQDNINGHAEEPLLKNVTKIIIDSSTQTEIVEVAKDPVQVENKDNKVTQNKEKAGWDIKNDEGEKSIADQVKEVAQSALQQSGMVYVESAGMYYDYKTGYYYNSELGLYYHTDTGCYYVYSDDKKSFVFHSYPDRSAENPALAAHEKKKAKKLKKEQEKEVDIDNLTKHMSQGEDEESSKSKKRKVSKKTVDLIEAKKPKKVGENSKEGFDKLESTIVNSHASNCEAGPSQPHTNAQKTDEKMAEAEETSDEKMELSNEKGTKEEETLKKPVTLELEDGECSESENEASGDEKSKSSASTSSATDDDSIARHHPPCMRIIVKETNLTRLRVGNLFIITKDGGTIGREGDQHAIIVNDYRVSRNHCDIHYDMDKKIYLVTDLGSKNGTILNGIRMSECHVISNPMEIMHGSLIEVGDTKFLCHIHPGHDTCGHCEPGLILAAQEKRRVAYTRTCNVQRQHQLELARLKNKYAPRPLAIDSVAYNDRAQARRETVGSSHPAEKTQASDLETSIPAENKGFKLLEKMGWSKGEGLGKDSQGGTEPIPLVSNEGTSGLGCPSGSAPQPLPMNRGTNTLGPATLRLVAKTKMLNKPAKAFQNVDYDDDSD